MFNFLFSCIDDEGNNRIAVMCAIAILKFGFLNAIALLLVDCDLDLVEDLFTFIESVFRLHTIDDETRVVVLNAITRLESRFPDELMIREFMKKIQI